MKFLFTIILNCVLLVLAIEAGGRNGCSEEDLKKIVSITNDILDKKCTINQIISELECEHLIQKFSKELRELINKYTKVFEDGLDSVENKDGCLFKKELLKKFLEDYQKLFDKFKKLELQVQKALEKQKKACPQTGCSKEALTDMVSTKAEIYDLTCKIKELISKLESERLAKKFAKLLKELNDKLSKAFEKYVECIKDRDGTLEISSKLLADTYQVYQEYLDLYRNLLDEVKNEVDKQPSRHRN